MNLDEISIIKFLALLLESTNNDMIVVLKIIWAKSSNVPEVLELKYPKIIALP